MSLADHVIWWHVYPLGACGAPAHQDEDGEHPRLRRLQAWLDHVVELGCSGLLLGPVFASTSHGYDTIDHFRVDPRLGSDSDLDDLIAQARARGLSVMLDGVFNHVGIDHPLVTSGSPLVRRADGQVVTWEGHGALAELDHDRPEVADLVVDVMTHWLRRGVAGWRLDVAYAVPTRFWREVLGRVRAEFPDVLFLGEVIHGDYAAIATEATLDSVTQYELWKAIWSALSERNLWELAWALDRHEEFSRDHVMATFVGNHDVTRIASRVGDDGAALAAVLLLTLPGMPSVYYGDEHGFRGEKGTGWGADDALRPALPETPADLAPHGQWLYRVYRELIGLRRRHPWLTRSSVRVVAKDNTSITYECHSGSSWLRVDLALDPRAQATVRADDGETWTWQAG